MEKLTVLGIGNRLMKDDRIGIRIVEELGNAGQEVRGPRYVIGETDIDFCMEQVMESERLVIIDALFSGKEPGAVSMYRLEDLHTYNVMPVSPHNEHLFSHIHHLKTNVSCYVIAVEPCEISFGMELSPQLEEKFPDIVERAAQLVRGLISRC